MASQPQTLASLQYLRAIAAMMVVYHHAIGQIDAYSAQLSDYRIGPSGVDLFFVLSGFIMYYITDLRPQPALQFLKNRLIRVAPIYWLVTLVVCALVWLVPTLFKTTQIDATTIAMSLLFIPHYSLAFPGQISPILVPGWTLNYEMFFYALFALALLTRSRAFIIAGIIISLVLLGRVSHSTHAVVVTFTHNVMLEFLFGVLIGKWFLRKDSMIGTPTVAWAVIGAGAVGMALLPQLDGINDLRFVARGIPAALIVLGVLALERTQPVRFMSLPLLLGNASYSLYLTHILALGLYRELWRLTVTPTDSTVQALLFILTASVFCAAVGIASYRMLERPMDRWLRGRPS